MEFDNAKIEALVRQAASVKERAVAVIASAQSQKWPHCSLNHATRLFCAVVATQARELAERAVRQVGLELRTADQDLSATAEKFFVESATQTGTDADSMATARIAAMDLFVRMALDTVARAERVLEGDESLSGQPIVHGALWYK